MTAIYHITHFQNLPNILNENGLWGDSVRPNLPPVEIASTKIKERRTRVEQFYCEIGFDQAQSTSDNRLEKPRSFITEEFTRRVKDKPSAARKVSQVEALSVTDEIGKIGTEIDEHVKVSYEVGG